MWYPVFHDPYSGYGPYVPSDYQYGQAEPKQQYSELGSFDQYAHPNPSLSNLFVFEDPNAHKYGYDQYGGQPQYVATSGSGTNDDNYGDGDIDVTYTVPSRHSFWCYRYSFINFTLLSLNS